MRRPPLFAATGHPVQLGAAAARSLADITEFGQARSVTLVVGLTRGQRPHNRRGRCQSEPERYFIETADRVVLDARAAQVGREHVGVTRTAGRGFFQGQAEDSAAYLFAFIPAEAGGPPIEPTYQAFRDHLDRLAEQIAEELCQDEVLILRDEGHRKTAAGATWRPRR